MECYKEVFSRDNCKLSPRERCDIISFLLLATNLLFTEASDPGFLCQLVYKEKLKWAFSLHVSF